MTKLISHRREIDALERAELVAAWAAITAKKKPVKVSGQIGPKPQVGRPAGGIREAARDLGMARKSVERAVKVAGLAPAAKDAAKAHGLPGNQSALIEA
tara:strand:- start:8107 stop:8403 length:297 start_codon:yes stop_codon:yes gene_type:complete